MTNRLTAILSFVLLLAGCKSPATKQTVVMAPTETPAGSAPVVAAQLPDPPTVDVGIGVDQAYQAIPHRRSVWREDGSSVPAGEAAYLRAMFQVLDQAVAVRVAGQQYFGNRNFDALDICGQYDRLLTYARSMPVPTSLASYHSKVLEALQEEKQFFADWKYFQDGFVFARNVGSHPGLRRASADLRAAYGELMARYPQESQNNKDAFFDYHCALDFL
jgi:hypothetical protein